MTKPAPDPTPCADIETALDQSLSELRSLERMLLGNGQREAGVFLSQIKLIITKVRHGIVVERSHYLNLLEAAQRISKEKR